MAISKTEAIRIVETRVNEKRGLNESGALVVVDDYQTPYGWVFYLNTSKYLETGDRKYCLMGGVLMFDTRCSSITNLPSGGDAKDAAQWYEKMRAKQA